MALAVTFAATLVFSFVSSGFTQENFTDVWNATDDATNNTAVREQPEITIFRIDNRTDKERFLEASRNARKLWNRDYRYQRDIRITKAQLAHIYGVDKTKDETSYVWPDAKVPFSIGRKVLAFAQEIRDAMRQWEDQTCVRFVEDDKNSDHVRFVQSRWAYSYLGRQGGLQKIGIPSVFFPDTHYAHLIGHTLGLRHTHAESNRDTLYHVAWDSVPERYRYNFDQESPAYGPRSWIAAPEFEYGFDWSSVMADESESVDGDVDFMLQDRRVVYPTDPFYLYRTATTEHPSFFEYKKVNQLYRCNERCPNVSVSRCMHGGYLGPQCDCVCPPGTVGDHCEHRVIATKNSICGGVVLKNKTINFVSVPSAYHCTWWIRAPQGHRVSVTFGDFSADNSTHSVGSCDLYFELRSHDLYKGDRYCWYELPLDMPLYAEGKDFLVDYFGSKDANFNFTLTATMFT
ncbi:zinc metalloproteinase nas-27-like [Amblyomma americanum]